MGLFGKRKDKIVDWSNSFKSYEKKIPASENVTTESSFNSNSNNYTDLGVLANFSNMSDKSSDTFSKENSFSNEESSEKRQKLAKRLLDMTNKIEELSNQVYHLTQRLELLEKKLRIASN